MPYDPPELSSELREFAKAILALAEPLVRAVSALNVSDDGEPGRCQQIWCPLCAAVAMSTGEQHPLATAMAEHVDAVLSMVRAVVDPPGSAPPEGPPEGPANGPGRYEPIAVTVHR